MLSIDYECETNKEMFHSRLGDSAVLPVVVMLAVILFLLGLEISVAENIHLNSSTTSTTESPGPPLDEESTPTLSRETVLVSEVEKISTAATESISLSTASVTETITWEPIKEYNFPIWDKTGKLCLLAKFHATFTIFYRSRLGKQKVVVKLPKKNIVKGICASNSQNPILQIFWPQFSFSLIFSKLPHQNEDEAEYWGVKSMELAYDSSGPLFDEAVNAGNKSAKFLDDKIWLQIPINKSYYCTSPEDLFLYNNKKEKKVIVSLKNVEIQPYGIVNGQFSEAYQCNQISVESEPEIINRDETVPIAVGSTFAVLTLIGVSGYAIYRTITARRVDYSTME